ncbi:MAG TPA: GNAT family N-acetyltransferase [Spirochaetia bacterium]
MSVTIREARPVDAAAVAKLSGELGYPVETGEMAKRLKIVDETPDHVVLVACRADGTIIGWADLRLIFDISVGRRGEIAGLVVGEGERSVGVGRELVRAAEQWVSFAGVTRMLVRSNVVRERAHGFYLREGYTRAKTSAVFEKELPGA